MIDVETVIFPWALQGRSPCRRNHRQAGTTMAFLCWTVYGRI